MVVPLIFGLIVYAIYPLIYLLGLSASESTLGQPFREWVGFSNYVQAATDSVFRASLWRAILFAVPVSLIQMVLGVAIALLLNASIRKGHILRTLILLPLMTPPVMAAIVWRLLLAPVGGLLNITLENLGITDQGISFLAESPWAFFSIMAADTWQWTPFVVLMSYAALQSLPEDIHEAAQVDGASGWRIFWSITLPMVLPALLAIELLRLIIAFKVFDLVFVLTSGGPGFDTTIGSFEIYRTGLEDFNVGYAAAETIVFAVIIGIVILPFMQLRDWSERKIT